MDNPNGTPNIPPMPTENKGTRSEIMMIQIACPVPTDEKVLQIRRQIIDVFADLPDAFIDIRFRAQRIKAP